MAHRLTDSMVKNLPPPAVGNKVYYDTKVTGLGCRVTAERTRIVKGKVVVTGAARSFVLTYRTRTGRQGRTTIGSFPAWDVDAAREEAKKLKQDIDKGGDPARERQAARKASDVATLAARYQAETRKRPSTTAEDASLLKQLILPRLGRLRVAAVRQQDIEDFHRAVSKATPVRANRALALLGGMFTRAVGWNMRTDNPCRGIAKNPEQPRERYLTPAELERLMAALAVHRNQTSANAIRLLLLTGARRGEVLGALWNQFDLTAGIWVKPASATKQGKLHRIPLSAPARQLLAEMAAQATGPALFPGRAGNERQGDLKNFWRSVCAAAGIGGVRVHDLRHSFASYLAGAGLSLPVIGALLGHRQAQTTMRYAHLLDDPLRQATERVGQIVTDAADIGKAGGAVIPIGKRG